MGGNLKVWVFNFRGKIFGGNTTVYISSGETNTVYLHTHHIYRASSSISPVLVIVVVVVASEGHTLNSYTDV